MSPRRWSVRQASREVGVSRTVVNSVITDGLIGAGELDACDVAVLKGATMLRTLLFPGEHQAANAARSVRGREWELAETLRCLWREETSRATCAMVTASSVTVCRTQGELITSVLAAHEDEIAYLVAPVGAWIDGLRVAGAGAGADRAA